MSFYYARDAMFVFAKSALLNLERSLNPIPPCVFGLHKSSHLVQCIIRPSPLCPQKFFRIRAFISWHKPLGNLKHDIV